MRVPSDLNKNYYMMKQIISYFLQGVIFSAPITITIYIIYITFNFIDGALQQYLQALLNINIPGLGILVLFVFLTLLGYFGQTIIARPFKRFFFRLLERAPLIKVIYSAIKDLFSAFAGKEKKFNKPVLVKVNQISALHKMGFITETDLAKINLLDHVAVYFPHSYNFSGEMFLVPKDQITPVDIPAADVMKFVVSGGVAGWD